jgi:hypothetical protein
MNLIDTVGINHIFKKSLQLSEVYYLAPDITEEVEMTELIHSKRIPDEVRYAVEVDEFDESIYLHHYKVALNSYKKRSFYNMKGFGDVSIIATVQTILDGYKKQDKEQLFSTKEPVIVYTGDANLTKVLTTEFDKTDVQVRGISDIK